FLHDVVDARKYRVHRLLQILDSLGRLRHHVPLLVYRRHGAGLIRVPAVVPERLLDAFLVGHLADLTRPDELDDVWRERLDLDEYLVVSVRRARHYRPRRPA